VGYLVDWWRCTDVSDEPAAYFGMYLDNGTKNFSETAL
jgi:hypothetical protein